MTNQTEQGATLPKQRVDDAFDVARHALSHGYNDAKSVKIIMDVLRERIDAAVSTPEGCALGSRELPNFDPTDLAIESFPRRPPGGMQVGMSVGVLVRHKPSGFSVIVDNHRSQHRNRDEALRQLAFLVHVFGDMPAATSHPTPKE